MPQYLHRAARVLARWAGAAIVLMLLAPSGWT